MVILLSITITSLPNVISPDVIRWHILVIRSQTFKQVLIDFPWLPKCIVLWAVIRKFDIAGLTFKLEPLELPHRFRWNVAVAWPDLTAGRSGDMLESLRRIWKALENVAQRTPLMVSSAKSAFPCGYEPPVLLNAIFCN